MSKSRAKRRRALRADVSTEGGAVKVPISGAPPVNGIPHAGSCTAQGDPGNVPAQLEDGHVSSPVAPSLPTGGKSAAERNSRYLSADVRSVRGLYRQVCVAVSAGKMEGDLVSLLVNMRHCLSHCQCLAAWEEVSSSLVGWCEWLVGLLRHHRSDLCLRRCHVLVCHILVQVLFVLGADSPEAGQRGSTVNSTLAGSIVSTIVRCSEQTDDVGFACSIFDCLRQMIVSFGRHCTPYKADIVRSVTSYVDSEVGPLSWSARRCYALFYRVAAPGVSGAAVAFGWRQQMLKLILSTHLLLDKLFDGITEQQSFQLPDSSGIDLSRADLLDVPESPDPLQRRRITCARAVALFEITSNQLSVSTRHPVCLPVTDLLNLATRCIHVSPSSVKAVTMETATVLEVVADLHAACMRMVRKMIVSCGSGLLLQASSVNRLLCAALLAHGEAASCSDAQNLAGKQAARALSTWLTVVGCSSGFHDNASQAVRALLVSCSLNDSTRAGNIEEKKKPVPTGGKRKRARTAADWSKDDLVSLHQPIRSRHAIDRCCESIESLVRLVLTDGPLLNPVLHERLLKTVHVQLASVSACRKLRAGMYRLLEALVVSNSSSCSPPHHAVLALTQSGVFDTDPQVVAASVRTMAVWSRSVRPIYPSLDFPPLLFNSDEQQMSSDECDDSEEVGLVSDLPENKTVRHHSISHENNGSLLDNKTDRPHSKSQDNAESTLEKSTDSHRSTNHKNPDRCVDSLAENSSIRGVADETENSSTRTVGHAGVSGGWHVASDGPDNGVGGDAVTTVTLGSSESGESGGEREWSVDRAADIVLDSDGETAIDSAEVQFVGQQPVSRLPHHSSTLLDRLVEQTTLTPDVAEMLKDFVNTDPEVE